MTRLDVFGAAQWRPAAWILVLALLLRVWSIIHWGNDDYHHVDPSEYLSLAYHLKAKHSFSFGELHPWGSSGRWNFASGDLRPTAARAPLYPTLIASLWWANDPPIFAIRLLQALLGAFTAVLIYLTAYPVFGKTVGAAAGLLVAITPILCMLTAQIMTETLFTFLLTLGIWLWGRSNYFPAGVILGFSALTRPILLPLIVLLIVLASCWRTQRRAFLLIASGTILVISPWTLRNFLVLHRFVPIATHGWYSTLLVATIPVPYGSGNPWVTVYGPEFSAHGFVKPDQDEMDAERSTMLTAAVERIRHDPLHWAWNRIKEYPRLFMDSGTYLFGLLPVSNRVVKTAMALMCFGSVLLAAWGVSLKSWAEIPHLVLFPALFLVMQLPAYGDVRLLSPVIPVISIFAAAGIWSLWTAKRLQ